MKKLIISLRFCTIILITGVFFPTPLHSQEPLPELVSVPGGTFIMGSKGSNEDEIPVSSISVSGFRIGKYEVTISEFKRFVDDKGYKTQAEKQGYAEIYDWSKKNGCNYLCDEMGNPRPSDDYGKYPVVFVSWEDALAYCKWLCEKTGKTVRLPSEAEFEYILKTGQGSNDYMGDGEITDYAWCMNNAGKKLHPVGKLQANSLGIYDMFGNAIEWCNDWYGEYSKKEKSDPKGPESGTKRVCRGSSFYGPGYSCNPNLRNKFAPDKCFFYHGFRVVVEG